MVPAKGGQKMDELSDLLDVVIHELRSPLTVARGYVRLMRDGTIEPAPPGWRIPLQMVEEKLADCQQLVDELMLSARLDSGAVAASATVINLDAEARRAVRWAQAPAALVGTRVYVDTPRRAVLAGGDAAHVERILRNLVSNALEHAGGSSEVSVGVGRDAGPFISVSDRGPGIPEQDRERIFARFVRGSDSRGSGLGLHLSRQLAEASRGSLTLDDAYAGPGARFVLRLPDAAVLALDRSSAAS